MTRVESPLVDADAHEIRRDPSADGPSEQVLTAHGTARLREECVTDEGHAKEWCAVTDEFEGYVMRQHAAADTWEEEKGVRPSSHRFTPHKAHQYTGKIYGGLRHVRDETPTILPLRTVLITLEGWPYDSNGQPAPPVEFLDGLVRGRRETIGELREILDGHSDVYQWGYCWVMEPHEGRRKGYPHCHIGVVVVGDVDRDELIPVRDTYVEANPYARPGDHGPASLTIEDARHDPDVVDGLGAELTNNLVSYEFDLSKRDIHDVPIAVRRFSALLWATGKQMVMFGKQFRTWIERSQDDWKPDEETSTKDVDPATYSHGDGHSGPEYVTPEPVDVAFEFPDERDSTDVEEDGR